MSNHRENNWVRTMLDRTLIPSTMALLGLIAAWSSTGTSVASAQPGIVSSASDYEDCTARAHASGLTKEAIAATVLACDSRFPGRRKPSGGYTYFDFMQNRHFDIAGPIPTRKELRQIDHAFIHYLANRNGTRAPVPPPQITPKASAGRPSTSATARRAARPHAATRSAKPTVTPRVPKRRHAAKSDTCRSPSLTCGWAHLTMQIKALKDSLLQPPSKELLISRLQRRDR